MDDYIDQLIQEAALEAAQKAAHDAAHDAVQNAKVECLISIIQKAHDVEYAMNLIGIREDEQPLYRRLVEQTLNGMPPDDPKEYPPAMDDAQEDLSLYMKTE